MSESNRSKKGKLQIQTIKGINSMPYKSVKRDQINRKRSLKYGTK